MLQTLVQNSKIAIDDGIYKIKKNIPNSKSDLLKRISANKHASIITEIKFSSPSLGTIRKKTDPVKIAKEMVGGGAVGLSVLTQPHLFNGSPEIFQQIRNQVKIPMLMKDIIIDKVQIDAAKKIGADVILLIQSIFDKKLVREIEELISYAHKKNLYVLVESHTRSEFLNSAKTSADLLGVNNRNLDTLKIDLETTKKILKGIDESRVILSESGIESPADIRFLHKCGANGFLVGSSIMKNKDVTGQVKKLRMAI